MNISKRFANVGDSSTLLITAKAKAMKANGKDIAILAAGEPDFDTPESIKQAAIKAIKDGYTGYTSVRGILPLRQLIVEKFNNDNHINYSTNEIQVTVGAKQAIYNIIQSICDEDSDVIVIAPYWVSYIEMIKMTGANPVVFSTEDDNFELIPEKLEEYITSRTRLVIINSPCNPTGKIIPKERLIKLSEIIVRHNIYCISDEIYEKIIYPGNKHFSIASINDEIKKLTFTVNGFSKAYAMTGWRIGYVGANEDNIKNSLKVQTHSTSCASSISQMAALQALKCDDNVIKTMVTEFNNRREYLINRINKIDVLNYIMPEGAFYMFIDFSKIIKENFENSQDLCIRLLEDEGVALIPGKAFGANNFIRLSFAASMEEIEKGVDRIEKFIEKYI